MSSPFDEIPTGRYHKRIARAATLGGSIAPPLAFAGVGLAALALRPQLTGVAPLLPAIQADLGVSHAAVGLLATIPIVCMGVFAPPAPYLVRRLGTRIVLALCLGVIAGFGLVRAGAPGILALLLATVPIGIAMGVGGAVMPIAIKERFAHRPVLPSGIYAVGLNIGAASGAAVAVPLAHALGGWRASLAVLSLGLAVLPAAWLALTRGRPAHVVAPGRSPKLPYRRWMAWALVAFYGIDAFVFFCLTSWLASAYVERGWSSAAAGGLVASFQLATIPGTLAVSAVADRFGSRRFYMVGGSLLLLVGTTGLAAVPAGGYAWSIVCGLALGALAPVLFALPLDLSERPEDVGPLAAMMYLGGSLLAAVGPLVLGTLRDATGDFSLPLWVLVGSSALLAASALPFTRQRFALSSPLTGVRSSQPADGGSE
jgi:CP family cyanate transporter-like MFS transporter